METSRSITEVLANSTLAFEAQGYTHEVAFDAAIATAISIAPDAMRDFLAKAQAAYLAETS